MNFHFYIESKKIKKVLQKLLSLRFEKPHKHFIFFIHSYYNLNAAKKLRQEINSLLRIPFFYELEELQIRYIVERVYELFGHKSSIKNDL